MSGRKEMSMQEVADEINEAEWRRKYGPGLEVAYNKGRFQVSLAEGKVPEPYASAQELLRALKNMVTYFAGFITDENEVYEAVAIGVLKDADAVIAKAESK